jgi:hypothetical protein
MKGGLDRWLRPSAVDRLVGGLPDVQIHVVGPGTDDGEAPDPGAG